MKLAGAEWSRGHWLARKDSNLRSPDPESGALPLGHSPVEPRPFYRRGPGPACSATLRPVDQQETGPDVVTSDLPRPLDPQSPIPPTPATPADGPARPSRYVPAVLDALIPGLGHLRRRPTRASGNLPDPRSSSCLLMGASDPCSDHARHPRLVAEPPRRPR